MKQALILYPHQLYHRDLLPDVQTVFVVEEPRYFGVDAQAPLRPHKQKLILHRASMRRYVEEVLWPAGFDVQYIELDAIEQTTDILSKTKGFDKVYVFDPTDTVLSQRLLQARRELPNAAPMEFLTSPNFYLKEHEVREYFSSHHNKPFEDFYQWQRERFNVLIDEHYKPVGGKWTHEPKSVSALPADTNLPTFEVFGSNKYVEHATKYVNKNFADNPGSTDFVWPTNHQEAERWLTAFLDARLPEYGTYRDTLDAQGPWLYHSAISPMLNVGLLHPVQVVRMALDRHAKQPVPIESLEAFIRGVVGWREYMRGLYLAQGDQLKTSNTLKHMRKLTPQWSSGGLAVEPYDDVVAKLLQRGYLHHNERLMIVGNLMLLSEIHPDEIYKWFMELFIDAYDWSVVGNVYGISQMADGGHLVSKPPFAASNYITQASKGYTRGEWSDIWDGLYWRFVEAHKDAFKASPSLRAATQRLGRLDPDHRRIIGYRADDFLARATKS
jgi:deoxyribodipyrimidine photolyase-related protein